MTDFNFESDSELYKYLGDLTEELRSIKEELKMLKVQEKCEKPLDQPLCFGKYTMSQRGHNPKSQICKSCRYFPECAEKVVENKIKCLKK